MKNLGFSYLNGTVLLRLGVMLATSLEMDLNYIEISWSLHLSKGWFHAFSKLSKFCLFSIHLIDANNCFGAIIELFATNITHNTVYVGQHYQNSNDCSKN